MDNQTAILVKTRAELGRTLQDARENYEANGKQAYDAGRYEGLKQALEIIDRAIDGVMERV